MAGIILSSDPTDAITKGSVLVAFRAIPENRQRHPNYHFFKKKDQLLPLGLLTVSFQIQTISQDSIEQKSSLLWKLLPKLQPEGRTLDISLKTINKGKFNFLSNFLIHFVNFLT